MSNPPQPLHMHTSLHTCQVWCVCVTMRQAVKSQRQHTDERIRQSDLIVSRLLLSGSIRQKCIVGLRSLRSLQAFHTSISLMNAASCAQLEADWCNVSACAHLHTQHVGCCWCVCLRCCCFIKAFQLCFWITFTFKDSILEVNALNTALLVLCG